MVILEAANRPDLVPFAYDGRPYVRLGTNTARMEQARYQELLLARNHTRQRWENRPADGITIEDLDHYEILRTIRRGIGWRSTTIGRRSGATVLFPGRRDRGFEERSQIPTSKPLARGRALPTRTGRTLGSRYPEDCRALRRGRSPGAGVRRSGWCGRCALPSGGYVAPLRISHDLTERQREILQAIA